MRSIGSQNWRSRVLAGTLISLMRALSLQAYMNECSYNSLKISNFLFSSATGPCCHLRFMHIKSAMGINSPPLSGA